jgi:hypothetical protein
LEPAKGEIIDASTYTPGKTKGYTFRDTVAEFNVLANGIEKRIGSIYE